jgi:ribosomal protein S18 acetylase RimI-like enzyme
MLRRGELRIGEFVPDDFLRAISIEERGAAWEKSLGAGESFTWVAENGDTALGWISAGRSRHADARESTGEIWAVYVHPGHWSKGVGRALCATAEDELRTQGFTDVTLWVLKDNERALRFYISGGFLHDDCADRMIERGGKALSEVRLMKQFV